MPKEEQISVKVYGQDFQLRVMPDEKELLKKAAKLVEQRMQEIASSGVINLHRIAMLAAIDIAFQAILNLPDMDANTKQKSSLKKAQTAIDNLIESIDTTLGETPQKKGGTKGGSK